MPRLYRPYIPLDVRCRVVLRQLGEIWPDEVIAEWRAKRLGLDLLLAAMFADLSRLLGCAPHDLHLDHDPPLALRKRLDVVEGGKAKSIYTPDANDPEHLIYRTKAAHDVKT